MTKRKKRDPAAFTDGTIVEYQPVMGPREPWYRGVVRGAPFKLGHGTWVVHLREMEPAYGEKVRSSESDSALRTHVHAALLEALRLVKPPRVAAEPAPMRAAPEPASLEQQTERLRAFAERRDGIPLGRIRDALDRTQAQTAYAIGVGSAAVCHTELHVDTATIATLTRYARALGGELEVAVRLLGQRVVVKVPPIGEKRSRANKQTEKEQTK